MKSTYQQFKDLSWSARKLAEFNSAFGQIESLFHYCGHDEELLVGIRELLENKTYRGSSSCIVSEFDIAQVLLVVANRVQVSETE
tara:strand:- start:32 stop:286 length:255 start_codon:yes stop_codon:yes gene_type:complete